MRKETKSVRYSRLAQSQKSQPKKSVDDLRPVIAGSLQDLKQLAEEDPEEMQAVLEVDSMALQDPEEFEMHQENKKLRTENAELRRKYIALLQTQTAQMKEIHEDFTKGFPLFASIQEEEAYHESAQSNSAIPNERAVSHIPVRIRNWVSSASPRNQLRLFTPRTPPPRLTKAPSSNDTPTPAAREVPEAGNLPPIRPFFAIHVLKQDPACVKARLDFIISQLPEAMKQVCPESSLNRTPPYHCDRPNCALLPLCAAFQRGDSIAGTDCIAFSGDITCDRGVHLKRACWAQLHGGRCRIGGAKGVIHRNRQLHHEPVSEAREDEFEKYRLLLELKWFHRAGLYGVR